MAAYLTHYPKINIELRLCDVPADPLGDGVDIAFRGGPLQDSSMIARPLPAFYATVLCAAPSYLRQHGAPRIPQELMLHHCLGRTRWGPNPSRFIGPADPVAMAANYRLRVDQGPALRELAWPA